MKLWPFEVESGNFEGVTGKPMISVEYKGSQEKFSAEQISSKILTKLKN